MYILIVVLIAVVCLLLMFAVLIQNPKGGGLGAGFATIGNQVMGARRTNDFMEKTTWTLVVILLSLSLLSAMFMPNQTVATDGESTTTGSAIKDKVAPNVTPNLQLPEGIIQDAPTEPTPAPTDGPEGE